MSVVEGPDGTVVAMRFSLPTRVVLHAAATLLLLFTLAATSAHAQALDADSEYCVKTPSHYIICVG